MDNTLFIPIPRRSTKPALKAVYWTRLWSRTVSELGPPTISLQGNSVACWKKDMSGQSLLKNSFKINYKILLKFKMLRQFSQIPTSHLCQSATKLHYL